MITSLLLLALALLLVLACGVFVAAEFALVTVDRNKVEQAAEAGDPGAQGVRVALRQLSTQLSGAQIGITVTNLGIGFLAEPAIAGLIRDPLSALGTPDSAVSPIAVALGLVISTVLTMLFGELVPKNLAIALPLRTARATQRTMRLFTAVNKIPIRILNGAANALVRRLGIEPQEELRSARSSQELTSLIQRSADEGTLDMETAELMERSVEFGTRTAGEIMTPRVRTRSLEATERASAVIDLARQTGHSRFPVLDADNVVVGTVHVKAAVALPLHERATTRVKHLMVKPTVVPDSLRLDPLLSLLRADGFQMAVVLDEYGGHAGIVTLEDVIEEIVGDISDEHDRTGSRARHRRDGTWVLSGLLRPDEVEDLTGVELPDHEDYDTVAGLVLKVLGRVPVRGDVAEVAVPDHGDTDQARQHLVALTVEHMDGLRIDRLSLRVLQPDADQPDDQPPADERTRRIDARPSGPAGEAGRAAPDRTRAGSERAHASSRPEARS
ncbi:hemolysin family protein [Nocardioides pantholopis]|uniref:hemolysin family protein n=1 Tax=Nocardioides pantholopis TaxID=2483798 RepID=UPI000F0880D2|nr:hemolysin family protein [Nocardioides pantholopis]